MVAEQSHSPASSSISDSGAAALLECRDVRLRFGGTVALDGVNFQLEPGEIHGIVGSNGAGKSSLMKILAGAHTHYTGQLLLDGSPIRISSPQDSLRLGISMVYQELSGVNALSVAENLFLGRQPVGWGGRIAWGEMYRLATRYLRELDIDVDVRRPLGQFPLVVRQSVEIARGIHRGARIVILDEPTSSLSPPECARLFQLIRRLKESGVAIVFISHFIEDVLSLCDQVTILRDGRRVETASTSQLDKHEVIHTMLGHALSDTEVGYETGLQLPQRTSDPPVLRLENASRRRVFQEVHLEVAPGECLGIYGYAGAGHQELAHAIANAVPLHSGKVWIEDKMLRGGNVSAAIRAGVVLVAADRAESLVHDTEIYKNVTLAHLRRCMPRWLRAAPEIRLSEPLLRQVGCGPAAPRLLAGQLSGGNQQKVVLAKWLLGPVKVLVLEEPTRGMDVRAKEEVMALVGDLKKKGTAIILASTEPELVMAHADRILVMSRGKMAHEFQDTFVTKADLMKHC